MGDVVRIPAGHMVRRANLTCEVVVVGQRRARFRIWLGLRLIKLAARIIGVGRIDTSVEERDS